MAARFCVTYQKTELAHKYIIANSQAEAEKMAKDYLTNSEDDLLWANEVAPTVEVNNVEITQVIGDNNGTH